MHLKGSLSSLYDLQILVAVLFATLHIPLNQRVMFYLQHPYSLQK